MLELSQYIYDQLTNFDAGAAIFNGDIFPIIAPQEPQYPICIYRLRENQPYTKSSINEYEVDIILLHNHHDNALTLSDQLQNYCQNQEPFQFQSTEATVNPEKTDEIIITQTYNIKRILN